MKRVLNVGGNSKAIGLPPQYEGYEHHLLDIDPGQQPDIVCDARELFSLKGGSFDAVYCSHNLEHYYRHDVPKVLRGFLHVLKDGGFAQVIVPDLGDLMRVTLENRLDLEDVLYRSEQGHAITVLDVLYGFGEEIERSGRDFFAHKTGFTQKSLAAALSRAGFAKVYIEAGPLAVYAMAFKGYADPATVSLFELADA